MSVFATVGFSIFYDRQRLLFFYGSVLPPQQNATETESEHGEAVTADMDPQLTLTKELGVRTPI